MYLQRRIRPLIATALLAGASSASAAEPVSKAELSPKASLPGFRGQVGHATCGACEAACSNSAGLT